MIKLASPILIIFLFVIIYSVVKGLNEAQRNKTKWQKMQEKRSQQVPNIKPLHEENLTFDKEVVSGERQKNDYVKPDVFKTPIKAKESPKKNSCVKEEINQELLFTEDNLLHAIILKEILDPPKALR